MLLERIKQGDRIEHYETIRLHKDGRRLHILLTILPIKDSNHQVVGGSVVAWDITGLKRTEKALNTTEVALQNFADIYHQSIAFMKDELGRYLYVEGRMDRLFNVELADLRGKTDFDCLPKEIANELRENDEIVLESGKNVETLETIPTPEGTPQEWLVLRFPYQDPSGKRFVGGVAIDITERKRAEDTLGTIQKELQRAVKELHEMNQHILSREQMIVLLKEELKRLYRKTPVPEHAMTH